MDEEAFLRSDNIDDYINHSCNPNSFIAFKESGPFLLALKPIRKGEEVTYNYLTTEWDMGTHYFQCRCGAEDCIGFIKGFKHLGERWKNKLSPLVTPYLRKKWKESRTINITRVVHK